jgi:hypothetical protein
VVVPLKSILYHMFISIGIWILLWQLAPGPTERPCIFEKEIILKEQLAARAASSSVARAIKLPANAGTTGIT